MRQLLLSSLFGSWKCLVVSIWSNGHLVSHVVWSQSGWLQGWCRNLYALWETARIPGKGVPVFCRHWGATEGSEQRGDLISWWLLWWANTEGLQNFQGSTSDSERGTGKGRPGWWVARPEERLCANCIWGAKLHRVTGSEDRGLLVHIKEWQGSGCILVFQSSVRHKSPLGRSTCNYEGRDEILT